jgi:hypothetical protein
MNIQTLNNLTLKSEFREKLNSNFYQLSSYNNVLSGSFDEKLDEKADIDHDHIETEFEILRWGYITNPDEQNPTTPYAIQPKRNGYVFISAHSELNDISDQESPAIILPRISDGSKLGDVITIKYIGTGSKYNSVPPLKIYGYISFDSTEPEFFSDMIPGTEKRFILPSNMGDVYRSTRTLPSHRRLNIGSFENDPVNVGKKQTEISWSAGRFDAINIVSYLIQYRRTDIPNSMWVTYKNYDENDIFMSGTLSFPTETITNLEPSPATYEFQIISFKTTPFPFGLHSIWVEDYKNLKINKRKTITFQTSSLPVNSSQNIDLNFYCKTYAVFSITTSPSGAWTKVYYSPTDRQNDSSRTIDQDPPPNLNLMFETFSQNTNPVRFSPTSIGYNEGNNNIIPITVTNLSNASTNFTININYLKLE